MNVSNMAMLTIVVHISSILDQQADEIIKKVKINDNAIKNYFGVPLQSIILVFNK